MTVTNAASDLVAFFVIATFILMGFTALFHFTLGMYHREFSSVAQVMHTFHYRGPDTYAPATYVSLATRQGPSHAPLLVPKRSTW